jgi:signal transduction histidine kinase
MLEDLGLAPALRWMLDRQGNEAGFSTSFTENLMTRLPPKIEIACFRVGQEALTNIMRHAHAHQVKMELEQTGQELHLTIEDDGSGFDVAAAYERARVGTSLGLISMWERVLLLGGHMEIESTMGQGTKIHASFPIIWRDQSDGSRQTM